MTAIVLAVAATAALLWLAVGALTSGGATIEGRGPAYVASDEGMSLHVGAPAGVSSQVDGDADQRMSVQLWTLVAAGGAAGVGLLLLLLRIAMGWVKPPPPQEEQHH